MFLAVVAQNFEVDVFGVVDDLVDDRRVVAGDESQRTVSSVENDDGSGIVLVVTVEGWSQRRFRCGIDPLLFDGIVTVTDAAGEEVPPVSVVDFTYGGKHLEGVGRAPSTSTAEEVEDVVGRVLISDRLEADLADQFFILRPAARQNTVCEK